MNFYFQWQTYLGINISVENYKNVHKQDFFSYKYHQRKKGLSIILPIRKKNISKKLEVRILARVWNYCRPAFYYQKLLFAFLFLLPTCDFLGLFDIYSSRCSTILDYYLHKKVYVLSFIIFGQLFVTEMI